MFLIKTLKREIEKLKDDKIKICDENFALQKNLKDL